MQRAYLFQHNVGNNQYMRMCLMMWIKLVSTYGDPVN